MAAMKKDKGDPVSLDDELQEELRKRDEARDDFATVLTASVPIHTERLHKARHISLIGSRRSRPPKSIPPKAPTDDE